MQPRAAIKVVLYRPHTTIWFKNPVRNVIKKTTLPTKYGVLLDYLCQADVKLHLSTRLSAQRGWRAAMARVKERLELLAWCVLNHIPLSRVSIISTARALDGMDVLFIMHYGNLTAETPADALACRALAEYLAPRPVLKVVHMTHYAYCPTLGATNLAVLQPDLLVAENNLQRNSPFFNRYFGALPSAFRCLPYTPAPRFRQTQPFEGRINKIVVTGSITYKMRNAEFNDYYHTDELQPMRRILFNEKDKYLDEMDCLVSDLNASRDASAPAAPRSFFARAWARLTYQHPQARYYGKNIVDIYNSYTMFAVPEEICDLPAIGCVEGMMCGAAYFGVDDPMYTDLGLQPGVHFVAYDGTPEGLMARVRHYQQHSAELRAIAETGKRFVESALNSTKVYSEFLEDLRTRLPRRNA